MLVPEQRPIAAAGRRRGAGEGRGRRLSTGRTWRSARATIRRPRALPTFPGSRSPARWSRLGPGVKRWKLGDQVIGAGGGRRLCRVTARRTKSHCLPVAGPPLHRRSGLPSRRTFFHGPGTTSSSAAASPPARPCLVHGGSFPASAPSPSSSPRRSGRGFVATAGSAEKNARPCRELGADVAVKL